MLARVKFRGSCARPGRKKRTHIVEVDVYTAIMREYEISNSICPLYRLGVIVKGV